MFALINVSLYYLDGDPVGVLLERDFGAKRGKDQDHSGAKINILKIAFMQCPILYKALFQNI